MKQVRMFLLVALAALLLAAPAQAEFGFKELGLEMSGTHAGAHPEELITALEMNTLPYSGGTLEFPDGQLEDLEIDMPDGFAGNPGAVPTCPPELFILSENGLPFCPNSTAVGFISVKAEFEPIEPGAPAYLHIPVYNMPPEPGYAAKLGFRVLAVPVTIDVGVRETPPYNVYARLTNTSEAAIFYASKATLWGNPADPVHDPLRGNCLEVETTSALDNPVSTGNCPYGPGGDVAFLTAPRSCEGPPQATFTGIAWNTGAKAIGTASAPAREECDDLEFEAEAEAQIDSQETESPTGLSFDLRIEDEGLLDPDGEALSDVKQARVTLPEGVTLNPSQAEGLAACSEADLARETARSEFGAGCPAASKVGTVEVQTPLLEGKVIEGTLFVAKPYENPFGSLVALYMVVKDRKLGISVKLPAKVETDPSSGRVTTTFGDPSADQPGYRTLPQLPLGEVHVNLPGGPRGPLVTPSRCGSYEIASTFTPWANPDEPFTTTSTFEVLSGPGGTPCPTGESFAPSFSAGSLSSTAGAYSPFKLRLTRSDQEAELTRLDTLLPPGLLGKLAGVERCSDAAIAAAKGRSGVLELAMPSCPAGSKVGQITAGAGFGSELTWVKGGSLFLAGPHGGAPLSVVAVTPAVAGPFDLGTVVVREALDIDPKTAQVRIDGAASDPIPTMLQGIPLSLRDLRVDVDRSQFTLNPTSCNEMSVGATLFSGARSSLASNRYQASDCAALAYRPELTLRLRGATKRGGHPSLRAVLTQAPGQANTARAAVTLPHSAFLEQAHIRTICTRVQFAADQCPPGSVYGSAKAWTPLLDGPLTGPVYLRSNGGERELPDLVAALEGPPETAIEVELEGHIDSVRGGIRTIFAAAPDAPVSRFVLAMQGGGKGLIANSRNLCGSTNRANVRMVGQNGKAIQSRPKVRATCKHSGKGRKGKKR